MSKDRKSHVIKRKDWNDYKKKHDVPDGILPKVSIGDALDAFHKSKQTDADLKKLENVVEQYSTAAKKAGHPKAAAYLFNHVNSEIAARQEEEARKPPTKPVLKENTAKVYRSMITTLTKYHANLKGVSKVLEANPGWFAKTADEGSTAKRDKLLDALQKELDKLFAYCRNEGGETVDISLAYNRALGNVAGMDHGKLVEMLNECCDTVKETADHLADRL